MLTYTRVAISGAELKRVCTDALASARMTPQDYLFRSTDGDLVVTLDDGSVMQVFADNCPWIQPLQIYSRVTTYYDENRCEYIARLVAKFHALLDVHQKKQYVYFAIDGKVYRVIASDCACNTCLVSGGRQVELVNPQPGTAFICEATYTCRAYTVAESLFSIAT